MAPGGARPDPAAESSAPTCLAPRPGRGGGQVSPSGAAATALCWAPACPPPPRAMAAGQDTPGHPLRDGDAHRAVSRGPAPWSGLSAGLRALSALTAPRPQGRDRSAQNWGLQPPGLSLRGSHRMHQVHGPGSTCDTAPACRHPTRSPRWPDTPHQCVWIPAGPQSHSTCPSDFYIQSQFHGQQVKSYRRSNLHVQISGEWKTKPRRSQRKPSMPLPFWIKH